MNSRLVLRTIVDASVFLLFVYAAVEATSLSRLARYLPLYVSIAGIAFSAIAVVTDILRLRRSRRDPSTQYLTSAEESSDDDSMQIGFGTTFKLSAFYLGWFLAYVAAMRIAGVMVSTVLFLLPFLMVRGKMRPLTALVSTLITLVILNGVREIMNLRWPISIVGW